MTFIKEVWEILPRCVGITAYCILFLLVCITYIGFAILYLSAIFSYVPLPLFIILLLSACVLVVDVRVLNYNAITALLSVPFTLLARLLFILGPISFIVIPFYEGFANDSWVYLPWFIALLIASYIPLVGFERRHYLEMLRPGIFNNIFVIRKIPGPPMTSNSRLTILVSVLILLLTIPASAFFFSFIDFLEYIHKSFFLKEDYETLISIFKFTEDLSYGPILFFSIYAASKLFKGEIIGFSIFFSGVMVSSFILGVVYGNSHWIQYLLHSGSGLIGIWRFCDIYENSARYYSE